MCVIWTKKTQKKKKQHRKGQEERKRNEAKRNEVKRTNRYVITPLLSAVAVEIRNNMGAKWQIHTNKCRERSQNNKNNVKIFKFNVNVRMCMLLSWLALLTNWFQQSNAHKYSLLHIHIWMCTMYTYDTPNTFICSLFYFLFPSRTLDRVFYSQFYLAYAVFCVSFSIEFSVIFLSNVSQLILKYTVDLFINVLFCLR